MNDYFYKIWIPFHLGLLISIYLVAIEYVHLNWILIGIFWFLIGPIGLGVGFHRLFSHRQFVTYRMVEYLLAILGTLSAYASLGIFIANHLYHHKHSDTNEDPSSSIHGFWHSFFFWKCKHVVYKAIYRRTYPFKMFCKDSFLKFISRYYVPIIFAYAGMLFIIDVNLLVNCFLVPATIEHLRLNCVNYFSHKKCLSSYRNFTTTDQSYNNLIIGVLGCGFGWHNNHHYNDKQLLLWHRWWEIDIEGCIGLLLTKRN